MRKLITGMVVIAALAALSAGLATAAQATAFTCSWNTGADVASDNTTQLHSEAQPTCGGGTGSGYWVEVQVVYDGGQIRNPGVLDYASSPSIGDHFFEMPDLAACANTATGHYAPNSQHLLKLWFGYGSCASHSDTNNQHAYLGALNMDGDTGNPISDDLCAFNVTVAYTAVDVGNDLNQSNHQLVIPSSC